jgi:hypothetical protein
MLVDLTLKRVAYIFLKDLYFSAFKKAWLIYEKQDKLKKVYIQFWKTMD